MYKRHRSSYASIFDCSHNLQIDKPVLRNTVTTIFWYRLYVYMYGVEQN